MADYVTLLGAEDVTRAGHNIVAAADTMSRAASTMDNAGDHIARTMDEAVTRFAGNLAEHDAERPTLRDYFAARFMERAQSLSETRDGGWDFDNAAQCCYAMADAMLKARTA